jgi:hypothetical protein
VAVVHLLREPLDRAALAGRVPALEQRAHGRAEPAVPDQPAELQAQRVQPVLPGGEPFLVLVAPDLLRQVDIVQAPHGGAPAATARRPSDSATFASV